MVGDKCCKAYSSAALKAGMTLSNEPGYYEDGKYGIRLENVVLVREAKTRYNFGDKGYLGFEHVTMYGSFFLSTLTFCTDRFLIAV